MDRSIEAAPAASSVKWEELANPIGTGGCAAFLFFGVANLFGLGPASSTAASILGVFIGDKTRVVAQLHEHLDGAEAVDLLAIEDVLHILGADEVLVHILLNFGEVAAYNLNELRRQMLCIQCVHTAEDELVDGGTHFVLHLRHLILLPFGGIGLSTTENREEVVLSEFFLRSKNARIDWDWKMIWNWDVKRKYC